ncbi:MAG: hypothetical protein ACT6Q8_24355 [Niveispirillum sp.]|uniref:hypothetical protein n=1 Tax=Niveispirillum sp. TaxID=1917217 RepID=UPI004036E6BD
MVLPLCWSRPAGGPDDAPLTPPPPTAAPQPPAEWQTGQLTFYGTHDHITGAVYRRSKPWIWECDGNPPDPLPATIDLRRWCETLPLIPGNAWSSVYTARSSDVVIGTQIIRDLVEVRRLFGEAEGPGQREMECRLVISLLDLYLQHPDLRPSKADRQLYALAKAHGVGVKISGAWDGIRRTLDVVGPTDVAVDYVLSDLDRDDRRALRDYYLPLTHAPKAITMARRLTQELLGRRLLLDLDDDGELVLVSKDAGTGPDRPTLDANLHLPPHHIEEVRHLAWHLQEMARFCRTGAQSGDSTAMIIAAQIESHAHRLYHKHAGVEDFLLEAAGYDLTPIVCPRSGFMVAPDWARWFLTPPDFRAAWESYVPHMLRERLLQQRITLAELRQAGYDAVPSTDKDHLHLLQIGPDQRPQPSADILGRVASSVHLLRQELHAEAPDIGVHAWAQAECDGKPILIPSRYTPISAMAERRADAWRAEYHHIIPSAQSPQADAADPSGL